jgi:hypothetical protein
MIYFNATHFDLARDDGLGRYFWSSGFLFGKSTLRFTSQTVTLEVEASLVPFRHLTYVPD